tara:strand:+ start:333 stop:725 length:393 start_codon:yes stop_codon:yes gene_type:complete
MIADSENTGRIENEIREYFGTHQVEFIEEKIEGVVEIALVTTSSHHGQKFLFHKSRGAYRQQALESLLDYIREHKAKECVFTIQWRALKDKELNTSYFSAPNIQAALDKFFFGRDLHSITVFSVSLNPLS